MAAARREIGQRGRWYKPIRCSICTSFIWFHPIILKEPVEAPEPRHEWVLCKPCHEALLVEMSRSTIRSAVRLRIATSTRSPEQEAFQREFTWFKWLVIFFALLHLVIFVVIWAAPK